MEYKVQQSKKLDAISRVKEIQVNSTWEKLWISFMVCHSPDDEYDEVLFTCPKVQVFEKRMMLMSRAHEWMLPKQGQDVCPW